MEGKSDFKYDNSLLRFRPDEKAYDPRKAKKAPNGHDFQMIDSCLTKTIILVSLL